MGEFSECNSEGQKRRWCLTCAYMAPVERFLSSQSTMCTSLRAHSVSAVAPGIDDVATQPCLVLSDMHANWNCRRRDSLAEIWMVPSQNWSDIVEMTCTKRQQRNHLCKEETNKLLQVSRFRLCWTHLALPKTCLSTPPSTPFKLKITSCASKSNRQPSIEPPCHEGKSCVSDFALCQIRRRQPSNAIEYGSSPMPYPSCIIQNTRHWKINIQFINVTHSFEQQTYVTKEIRIFGRPADLHNARCNNQYFVVPATRIHLIRASHTLEQVCIASRLQAVRRNFQILRYIACV